MIQYLENSKIKKRTIIVDEKLKQSLRMPSHSFAYGMLKGGDKTIKYYDFYRRISIFLWLILSFLLLSYNQIMPSVVCFGIVHLHILFNQLWWKYLTLIHENDASD